ncbi:MAG: hypothetical protein ABI565_13750 [Vicinamibacteria bacterium]
MRIEAPGVEAHHARIVIDITGAMIYRVDGPIGVNDDLVSGDALLRSGDFVWIGEPGGASSLMFQFTLGDLEAREPLPALAALVEAPDEIMTEDLSPSVPSADEFVFEEAPASAPMESAAESELLEMAPAAEPATTEPAMEMPDVGEPVTESKDTEVAAEPMMEEPSPMEEGAPAAEPLLVETSAEPLPTEIEPSFEPFSEFERPAEAEPPIMEAHVSSAPATDEPGPSEPRVVPPAPWQVPSSQTPETSPPAAEYASAWESPAPPAAESAEATVVLPAAPKPAPPVPPRAAVAPPARNAAGADSPARRPTPPAAPKMKIRTAEQDAALRKPPPPPPPARTTSSMPMILGGLGVLVVLGIVGFFLTRPAPAPVAPPTPAPTPVVVSTPTPEASAAATPEPTQVAVVEATPETAPPVAPTPRAAATPAPRTTPAPRATPTPALRTTPTPARPGPAPTVASTVTAPTAPVSQAPRLLDEARAAVNAKELPRASQLYGEVLKLEPGNAEATARKAEVDARVAWLNRKFSVGATTVLGGKATGKGPSGFDLGGGAVVRTDFSAQIRCTTTPTAVEPGTSFSIRCSILNIGAKAFKLESITANEIADDAKSTSAGVTPRQDIAPQSDAVIVEKVGSWTARSKWSFEIVAKTTKDESFRAVYNWR